MINRATIILSSALLLSLLSATGCQPKGIIPPKDMTALFAEFYRADAVIDVVQESGANQLPFDSLRVYRPILEARGYTDSIFRASLNYYLHEPRTLVKICTKARDELQRTADQKTGEPFIDDVERETPEIVTHEGVAYEVREGAEPEIEKPEVQRDDDEKPVRKGPQRKQRKKMTRQELKELEEGLK